MRTKIVLLAGVLAAVLTACPVDPGTPGPTTTTTTRAPYPTLVYTGVADKTLGCFSGLLGDDTFEQPLGTDGWWHFGFQGCTALATETVALIDPTGGPTGDAFRSPTGYQCKFEIDGTPDATPYHGEQIGDFSDTGGRIFLESSSAWPTDTTWRITCVDLEYPPATTTTTTSTSTTTTSTTTTTIPLPPLQYTGVADKSVGCYSGLLGDDTFEQALGADGWWHFGFQGCSLFSTETVALIDPAGGPTGDAFRAPTGYKCRFAIVGTSDGTGYFTDNVGSAADTGGLIFLESSSEWSSPTTWRIDCIQANTPAVS